MAKKKENQLALSLNTAKKAVTQKNSEEGKQMSEQSKESTEQLLLLPVSKIHVDPEQPRKSWDDDELEKLSESIKQTNGCKEPIKVKPHPTIVSEYMLIFGEGRLRSHKKLEMTHINAILNIDELTDFELRFEQLAENVNRADMTVIDKAIAIKNLIKIHNENLEKGQKKITQKEIGKKFGMTATYISRLMNVLKAPHQVQELSTLKITQNLNVLASLAQLSKLVEMDELEGIIKKVDAGDLTEKKLQLLINKINNKDLPESEEENLEIDYDLVQSGSNKNESSESDNTKPPEIKFDDEADSENKDIKTESTTSPKIENSAGEHWEIEDFQIDPTDNSVFIYIKTFEEPLLMTNELFERMKQEVEFHKKS